MFAIPWLVNVVLLQISYTILVIAYIVKHTTSLTTFVVEFTIFAISLGNFCGSLWINHVFCNYGVFLIFFSSI